MRVMAIERFEYANKLRMPGDEFDTDNDDHARVLQLAQRVKIVVVESRELKSEDDAKDVGRRQRYRNRQMKADE